MISIITSKALEALAMDFTQFEWSSDGRVCYCSHQCIYKVYVLSATGYQPTSTVVKTLVCDCFLVYGVHNHIHSDQGSCVAAEVMRGLCGTCGAKKSRIFPTILKEMGNDTTLSMICHAPLLLTRSDLSAMHTMWRTIPLQGTLPITYNVWNRS